MGLERRQACYSSIDIKILLKNNGDLFEIKKILIWNKSEKVFEKWMNICLHIKNGDALNIKEKEEQ